MSIDDNTVYTFIYKLNRSERLHHKPVNDAKIDTIKHVRNEFNFGLKHAKDIVEAFIDFYFSSPPYYPYYQFKNVVNNAIDCERKENAFFGKKIEEAPTLGDILKDVLEKKYLVITGETQSQELSYKDVTESVAVFKRFNIPYQVWEKSKSF